MISLVLDFLERPLIRFGGAALAIATAIAMWTTAQNKAEQRGATTALANVEKKNAAAKQMGERGASNGGKRVSGSVRDPGYRAE